MIDIDAWFFLIRHDEQHDRALHAFKEALAMAWDERGETDEKYEQIASMAWGEPPPHPGNPYRKEGA